MKKLVLAFFIVFFLAFHVNAQEDDEASEQSNASEKKTGVPEWLNGKNANLWRGSRTERYFEIGFADVNASIMNSQFSVFDLLKGGFDFDPKKMKGDFSLAVDILSKPLSFKFPVGKAFNMEIFTGFEATFYGNMGGDTLASIERIRGFQETLSGLDILNVANISIINGIIDQLSDIKGSMHASGNAYAEIGVAGSKTFFNDRLYVRVAPSVFFTLLYMPESSISLGGYGDRTTKYIGLKSQSEGFYAYSPFNFDNFNFADMFSSFGIDLALEGRFALFPVLDAGATISHIPILPSTLRYKSGVDLNIDVSIPNPLSPEWAAEIANGHLPDTPTFNNEIKLSNSEQTSKLAHRPTRFDFYAMIKPFSSNFLVVKPSIGFSLNTVLEKSSIFNWGVDVSFNLPVIFSATIGTGVREEIWKQHLDIELDFRVFELDFGIALQGLDFVNSWKGRGLGAAVAFKFGF